MFNNFEKAVLLVAAGMIIGECVVEILKIILS